MDQLGRQIIGWGEHGRSSLKQRQYFSGRAKVDKWGWQVRRVGCARKEGGRRVMGDVEGVRGQRIIIGDQRK